MYLFLLPTTGHVLLKDYLSDPDRQYSSPIAQASAARATVRDRLKVAKRTEIDGKDYPQLLKALDEYLPYLYAILDAIRSDHISLRADPVFSWRTTLSSSPLLTSQNPRLSFPSLDADLRFSLLTYAFALSNSAGALVHALGAYEHDPHLPDLDRQANDQRLNQAVAFLRQASGVFAHLAQMQPLSPLKKGVESVPDLSADVLDALSKLSLAEAQSLAIRKHLSKSAADTALVPGPPLPKSHPAPLTIAKLYLEVTNWLSSAKGLSPSTSVASSVKSKFRLGHHSGEGASTAHGEVSADLRRYLSEEYIFASAMSHKWLGVDAGELQKTGEAVGFLSWSKEELVSLGGKLKDISLPGASDKEKQRMKERKDRVAAEIKTVDSFLSGYKKQNDTIFFKPVPKVAELQALIPMGRAFVTPIPYTPPTPAFGSQSGIDADPNGAVQNSTEDYKTNYF